jgi:Flp pilus assembly pilin Flp
MLGGMTTDPRPAWDDVGAGCSELGAKLKQHFEQVRSEDAVKANEALRKLADAVSDAFEAVGNAARDPSVRADAQKVASTLADALGATFAGVGDEVKRIFSKDRKGGETAATSASEAPPATPPSGAADAPETG